MSAFDKMSKEDEDFFRKSGFIKKKVSKREDNQEVWNLLYMWGGKCHEAICTNKTYKFCNYMKSKKIESGNYHIGKLEIISNIEIKLKNIVI